MYTCSQWCRQYSTIIVILWTNYYFYWLKIFTSIRKGYPFLTPFMWEVSILCVKRRISTLNWSTTMTAANEDEACMHKVATFSPQTYVTSSQHLFPSAKLTWRHFINEFHYEITNSNVFADHKTNLNHKTSRKTNRNAKSPVFLPKKKGGKDRQNYVLSVWQMETSICWVRDWFEVRTRQSLPCP